MNPELGIDLGHELDVIGQHCKLQDLAATCVGYFMEDGLEAAIDALAEDWAPILGAPHHVVCARGDEAMMRPKRAHVRIIPRPEDYGTLVFGSECWFHAPALAP